MIRQIIDRKITVLILSLILLVCGVVNIGYADSTFYPHFHDESTTRSVAENTSSNTNIGNPVSAHSVTTLDRYVLGGTHAGSFEINQDNGQLKTKTALDYETRNSYRVTVTVQDGKISPLSDSITGPITVYTDKDSIDVTINVTDVANEASQADALPTLTSEEREHITALLTLDTVIFNELFNASNDPHDWVELRNVTTADVDLGGWRLIVATSEMTESLEFPIGTMIPAGELLLFLNTDPNDSGMPLERSEKSSYRYLVDETFTLPQEEFMLLLRSPSAWEDSTGNYLFGHEGASTAVDFTLDTAWSRAKPSVLGHQAEAWVVSGYHGGLGYDAEASKDIRLGTPGHRRELIEDANGDGVVNILDLVLVASQIGQSDDTVADINGDGEINIQDLVAVANAIKDSTTEPSAQAR